MRVRRRRRGPSWLGTLVVALAVVLMALRAAKTLRRSVEPRPSAPSSVPSLAPSATSDAAR